MDGKTFIPLHRLSQQLGLPAAWLKAEAEADRIPSLRVGRKLMFNREAVERVLLENAESWRRMANEWQAIDKFRPYSV